jgi:CARDB protein
MLRIATITAVLAALLAATVAARAADPPAGNGLVAKLIDCGVTTSDRSATFYARMDAVPGAVKLSMHFALLERLGRDDVWAKLDVPALRQWHTSQAGVKRFGWTQTVDNLHLGGAYKSHVLYRWLSATGAVLDTQMRDTPVCRGPLPNIALGALTGRKGPTADTHVYRIEVQNTGKIDADNVGVSLAVDKAVLDTITLDHLAAGDSRSVSFTGPLCRHQVRVKADPSNLIGERVEGDNSVAFDCP